MDAVISADATPSAQAVFRHRLFVRITHWANFVCLAVLLMSGLETFNAHPVLYLGKKSGFDHPILQIGAKSSAGTVGELKSFGHSNDTTGFIGVSNDDGQATVRAFPA